jgi:hypothetical protein
MEVRNQSQGAAHFDVSHVSWAFMQLMEDVSNNSLWKTRKIFPVAFLAMIMHGYREVRTHKYRRPINRWRALMIDTLSGIRPLLYLTSYACQESLLSQGTQIASHIRYLWCQSWPLLDYRIKRTEVLAQLQLKVSSRVRCIFWKQDDKLKFSKSWEICSDDPAWRLSGVLATAAEDLAVLTPAELSWVPKRQLNSHIISGRNLLVMMNSTDHHPRNIRRYRRRKTSIPTEMSSSS